MRLVEGTAGSGIPYHVSTDNLLTKLEKNSGSAPAKPAVLRLMQNFKVPLTRACQVGIERPGFRRRRGAQFFRQYLRAFLVRFQHGIAVARQGIEPH